MLETSAFGGGVGTVPLGVHGDLRGTYAELGVVEAATVHGAVALVLGVLVLGLLPGYGTRSLRTARRSPTISILVGIPATLVLASLFGTGVLIADSALGSFFAVPLVIVGLAFLPAWTALGFVAIGAVVGTRVGVDSLWGWVVLGAVFAAVVSVVPHTAVVVGSLAAVVGTGAGARALFRGGGLASSNERVVPPANKI